MVGSKRMVLVYPLSMSFFTQRVFRWMPNSLSYTECSPCSAESHWYPAYANRPLKVGAQCRMMPKSIPGKSFVKDYFKEPLNNKPYILVKHAIQAFFQNTWIIFTQICFFSLVSCFIFCKRADFPLDLCCGKFSTSNRQRMQIGTGKQDIQTIFVFL